MKYVDGSNLYEYARSNPVGLRDHLGLAVEVAADLPGSIDITPLDTAAGNWWETADWGHAEYSVKLSADPMYKCAKEVKVRIEIMADLEFEVTIKAPDWNGPPTQRVSTTQHIGGEVDGSWQKVETSDEWRNRTTPAGGKWPGAIMDGGQPHNFQDSGEALEHARGQLENDFRKAKQKGVTIKWVGMKSIKVDVKLKILGKGPDGSFAEDSTSKSYEHMLK